MIFPACVNNNKKNYDLQEPTLSEKISIWSICILFLTPARSAVILLLPFLIYFFTKIFKIKVSHSFIYISFFIFISCSIGLITETMVLSSFILTLYIILPIIYLIINKYHTSKSKLYLNYTFKCSEKILYIVNLIGFSYDILHGYNDDAFAIGYGMHFERMNGLAIINLLIFLHLLIEYSNNKRELAYKLRIAFFFLSFVCCSYGAGIIYFTLVIITLTLITLKFKYIIIIPILAFILFFSIKTIHSSYFNYYISTFTIIIEKGEESGNARKLTMFKKSKELFLKKPIRLFLFGLGGGSYNSRIAFLLNKESNNPFTFIFGSTMPPYHSNYIFPLHNKTVSSTENYTDGGRNKPMSSFISILFEFGIIVFILFWGHLIKMLFSLRKKLFKSPYATYCFISLLYILFANCAEQWLETSEFVFFSILFSLHLNCFKREDYKCTYYDKEPKLNIVNTTT